MSALLHRRTSEHKSCLQSFRTEHKLKSQENVCRNKDFSGTVMPPAKDKILQINQYMKPDKIPYIIYAGIESWAKKIDTWGNYLENSSTMKIGEHIPYRHSMWTMGKIAWKRFVKL